MRLPSVVRYIILIWVLLSLVACQAAPAVPPSAAQASATAPLPRTATATAAPATATVTATPTLEPSPTPEPPPPPGDALEQMLREVEAGKYTLEQGLTQSLDAMLNGGTFPYDESQIQIAPHLTTLVRYADYLLETGTDEATKAKLAEILGRLFPSEAELDAVARPEGSSRAPWGLASIPNGCSV